MRRPQHGAGGIFIFVILMVTIVLVAALFTLTNTSTALDLRSQTSTSLAKAAAALEQFASQTGRLPCPADPTQDTGLAVPNSASVNCTNGTGTLPWATIGMRRDDAIDAWGWKIGYRVYSGNGGVTQDQGASMVNCDIFPTLGSAGVDGRQLCRSTHATLPSEFLVGKGLDVSDFGTPYNHATNNGAAYVVISYGPTGFGAYTSSGVQNPNSPKSTDEKNNLQATGPFVAKAATTPDVPPDDNTHFDDILLYRTFTDLATKANLLARNWPDDYASLTFTASNLQAALGLSSAPTPNTSLGVSSLLFYGATVSSASGNISYYSDAGGEGIGVTGGGGSNANMIQSGESLRVKFAKLSDKLAITLDDFGGITFFGFIPATASVQFYKSGVPVGSATTLKGCQNNVAGGGPLASFTITPGLQFDEFQVTNSSFFFPFILSAVRSCSASDPSCITLLDNGAAPPSGNHCPWP